MREFLTFYMAPTIYFNCDHPRIVGMEQHLHEYVDRIRHNTAEGVEVIDSPEDADYIIFLEVGDYRPRGLWFSNPIRHHSLVQRFPAKCYMWSYEDHPFTYLPGLYASMPREFFDPKLHRAYRYFHTNSERFPVPPEKERDLLYNFVGGATSPVRRAIFNLPKRPDALVQEKATYNAVRWADDEAVSGYIEVLSRSRFTLCPAGSATSSYRLFESLRAGSVPVIISDRLVLPEGPDWSRCSVRVAEKDIASIPERLEAIADVEVMRAAAWGAHEKYFAFERMLDHLVRELSHLGPADQQKARQHYVQHQSCVVAKRIWSKAKRDFSRTRVRTVLV